MKKAEFNHIVMPPDSPGTPATLRAFTENRRHVSNIRQTEGLMDVTVTEHKAHLDRITYEVTALINPLYDSYEVLDAMWNALGLEPQDAEPAAKSGPKTK